MALIFNAKYMWEQKKSLLSRKRQQYNISFLVMTCSRKNRKRSWRNFVQVNFRDFKLKIEMNILLTI